MEGGNFGRDSGGRISDIDDLALLTTNFDATGRLLGLMRDTSAATALASRMAAQIQGAYPNWWPETIRGLMVHSAAWNNAMKQTFDIRTQAGKLRCLRCYGYGVPNLQQALWSANNSATLIFEGELQPFDKVDGKMKTKDMHLHSLPWPEDVLRELGDAPVTMRVTLSYFIEPNPGRRWANPMRYASFGLRFAVKRPLDSLDEFRRRISKAAWEEEDVRPVAHGENQPWYLGDRLQKLGSIHSDWWKGTAAELADSGVVAVYPVIGWWRERPQLERWKKYARYSLMATISTPDAEVDLYTPIAVQVGIPVDVDI